MKNVNKNSINISEGFNTFAKTMMSISDLNRKHIDLLSSTMYKALDSITSINQCLHDFSADYNLNETVHNMFHQLLLDTSTDVSIVQDTIGNYLDQVQDRVIALTSLNHHLLMPSLVSPVQLQATLDGIEKELLWKYAPFKFGFDSLDYFYSIPSTTYLADDDYLYAEINILLSVVSVHYHIYEVHTVPLTARKSTSQYMKKSLD